MRQIELVTANAIFDVVFQMASFLRSVSQIERLKYIEAAFKWLMKMGLLNGCLLRLS